MIIAAMISIIVVIIVLAKDNKRKNELYKQYSNNQTTTTPPVSQQCVPSQTLQYQKKYLLTKNEWYFYKTLKPVADELGLSVLAKIRVADIIEVNSRNRSDWQKSFNKISNKHVDFALAKPDNLQIVLLIELDDSSHDVSQIERDNFLESIYAKTGYKLLRLRGTINLKEQIEAIINQEAPHDAGI